VGIKKFERINMFPKNAWYVAATSEEIKDKPFAREVCLTNIVFYRNKEGKVIALEDFCTHRGAAMSLGYIEDGDLVCGYHGLKAGCKGKIIEMPGQDPKKIPCLGYFPVVEKYGFIWIWPGKKENADESLIPHLEWHDNPEWAYAGGVFDIKCDYRFMIDNLMDLTHEKYVHGSSIGQEEIDESPVTTEFEDGFVVTSRYMNDIEAPPFWQMCMKHNNLDPTKKVDRWQKSKFVPPGAVLIDVGVALKDKGGKDAPKEDKVRCTVVDFMTPQSETSMWYFWGMARSFKPEDNQLTQDILKGQGGIFEEDLEVLEFQQKNLEKFPNRSLISLDIDAGGKLARRVLKQMIKEED
jgi:vanillate O-demethylase monooxygenase subunit